MNKKEILNSIKIRKKTWKRVIFSLLSCILIIIGSFLIIATKRIIDIFGNISFDQILFHISMPSGTVNSQIITSFFAINGHKAVELALLLVVIFCILAIAMIHERIFILLSKIFHYISDRPHVIFFAISFQIFLIGFFVFTKSFNVFGSLIAMHQKSTLIDEYYYESISPVDFCQFDAEGKEISIAKKPNLILIISESLESTFSDKRIFEINLIPEIMKLREEGDYTPDLFQVNGCHYTIASMYSIQYGLPLLYLTCIKGDPVQQNIFHAKCISMFDVLASAGYQVTHLQGTTLRFAGQGTLFEHIPNARIIGLDEISIEEYPQRQMWGLWDSDLFNKAKAEILINQQSGRPFALSIQTIDTHFGNTVQPGQITIYGDIRDTIALQSKLLAEFVGWIREQPFGDNSVIVIVGDHNMMTNKIGNINLLENERRVFNCILNAKNNRKIADRKAALYDFAPTILDALGFEWPTHSLGIGRSLYREQKTLLEKYGISTWNKESMMYSRKYRSLIE